MGKIKFLCFLTIIIIPSFVMAQASGGQIKRKSQNQVNNSQTRTNSSQKRSYAVDEMFELGSNYYDNGYYSEAISWYKKAANQGHVEAQSELGHIYFRGEGVSVNYNEAAKWLKMAADNGDYMSQYTLGYMYDNGVGFAQDKQVAKKWYQLASPNYYKGAKSIMGSNGEFAVSLFVTVYNMGISPYYLRAAFQIGIIYYYGFGGVKQDYIQARRYFTDAANVGCNEAKYYIGLCYENAEKDHNKAEYWKKSSGYTSAPNWDF